MVGERISKTKQNRYLTLPLLYIKAIT